MCVPGGKAEESQLFLAQSGGGPEARLLPTPPCESPPSQGRTPSPLAKAQNCPNGCPNSPLLSHTFFLSQTHRHTPGTADLRAPVYFPGAMASRQHWSENKKETHRGHRVSLRASLCEHCLGIQTPLLPKKQGGRFSSSSPLQRARPLSPGRLLLCWGLTKLTAHLTGSSPQSEPGAVFIST